MDNRIIMNLIPGNSGKDCPFNGKHKGTDGKYIECCCDECDYMMCCTEHSDGERCKTCEDYRCPKQFK